MLRPAQQPYRGAVSSAPYSLQPADSAPFEAIRDVRPFDSKGRRRMTQRPALVKAFAEQLPGPIQFLGVIGRASIQTGTRLGECSDIDPWTSVLSPAIAGQVWWLKRNRGMYARYYEDVTGEGGPATNSVNAVAINADGDRICTSSNYVDSSTDLVSRIRCFDLDGNVQWTHKILETGRDRYTNTIAIGDRYVYVATNQEIRVIRLSDGTPIADYQLGGWASEVVELGIYTDTSGQEWLYAGFNGATAAGTYTVAGAAVGSGTIAQGKWAKHFRAGVMKIRIDYTVFGSLRRVNWGSPRLTTGQAYYEASHGYARISELTNYPPHGALVTAMGVDSSGNVYVARTNQGWGPNAAHPFFYPDGQTSPYISVMKLNAEDGSLAWETDTLSVREVGDGGYINDIPTGASDDPSLLAVRPDAAGDVYVAGRQNQAGQSLMKLAGSTGSILWSMNLMSGSTAHRQACIQIDPNDDQVVVGGDRNTSWDGAGGANAHLWKVPKNGGSEPLWSHDLGAAVSALGLAIGPDSEIIYGTDKV